MKKVAIAIAVLAALGSTVASADESLQATATLSKHVDQECNIGLWATGNDGSVGGDLQNILGTNYGKIVNSELNDVNTEGQSITGAVKCNANGGYKVEVIPTYGKLVALDSTGKKEVDYELNLGNAENFANSSAFITSGYTARQRVEVGRGTGADLAKFRMVLTPKSDFTFAGQYTEVLTFDLTPF